MLGEERAWDAVGMRSVDVSHKIPQPSAEDLERIGQVLREVGGSSVAWGAEDSLNLWVIEQRARLDKRMSARLEVASWSLVAATVALVVCTAGLIWATLAG